MHYVRSVNVRQAADAAYSAAAPAFDMLAVRRFFVSAAGLNALDSVADVMNERRWQMVLILELT